MTDTSWVETLKFDDQGLLPCVVQDVQSREVLMLAYMNHESVLKTLETGTTWFWSRSRQEFWNKGATSGHFQQVVRLSYDCDRDTLLAEVNQAGAACHTGAYSCFFEKAYGDEVSRTPHRYAILDELLTTIAQRDAERPEGAYTTYLFEKGLEKILKKVGEESTEVVIAAMKGDREELTAEVGDVIYHLFVLLQEQKLSFDEVLKLLEARHSKKDIQNKQK
ncbi:bifunctional phosphoribosyl-AMP cyclohydrolase/phosphoribosyl-ATP diphosphatase HisIE [Tumebacillus sp. ITR2]|uniref:Histidine biosynthesis bifunctional protein HisIE n=1 Tax=Tumebacillus amylolyticus TaxID=2801339 RepID=A0ABS1J9P3_9BACL|nr:bifunctional phosphoribosyl-AMP cyclohydrolase/phosphoribosyl-ATP diphosphatase HisIE [Tumebacillus amylolyticus]MBL0386940.1 bifunctional phosphoribosyl-AMP cyclohydrolase/phosphoribosyl-ATP diphosphatase HisIE [Tumebacillus amylolyticus]